MNIPTPHIGAKQGEIAKKVLMPGDPLRAKRLTEAYLENAREVTSVRNMLGFTGTYQGEELTVMGGGMGVPSIGIYSYELYNFYNVDTIIRIGSAGGITDDAKLMDIVIAQGVCTDSHYGDQYELTGTFAPIGDFEMIEKAVAKAKKMGIRYHVGNVFCTDRFYDDRSNVYDPWKKMGVLCVEMECAGLYMNAARAGKKALALLTITDHVYTRESLCAEKRQNSLTHMMEIALEV